MSSENQKVMVASSPVHHTRTLAIAYNGNNERIGNVLQIYGSLIDFAERNKRNLSFPFAENVFSKIFVRRDKQNKDKKSVSLKNLNALYMRTLRSAEEFVESEESVDPYQYSKDVFHSVIYDTIKLKVLFANGRADWQKAVEDGEFDHDFDILMKDPLLFTVDNSNISDSFKKVSERFILKDDVLNAAQESRSRIAENRSGTIDICIHWRRGDYRRWSGGEFFLDNEIVVQIIETIKDEIFVDQPITITLVSDEEIPHDILALEDVYCTDGVFETDFARLMMADIIVTSYSSFSMSASHLGENMLGQKNKLLELGRAKDALDNLRRNRDYLTGGPKPRLPSLFGR